MVFSTSKKVMGKRKDIGTLCFDEGRGQYLVGYHRCNGVEGKILVDVDEAREFIQRIGGIKAQRRKRLIMYIAKRYGL